MATATGNFAADNSSLANFKAWAQFISNAFSTFGWTQTADTGQVNWASIAAVPSNNYVYEIWKQNDALASSLQIFIKIEYGFSGSQVGIRVTVGTGSNGSGTITGSIAFSAQVITAGGGVFNNNGGTLLPCYASGSAGEIRFLMWINTAVATVPTFFCIERSKDATGADTGDYVTCLYNSGQSSASDAGQQTIMSAGTVTAKETALIGTGITTNNGTGSFGGTVAAFPIFPFIGKLGNPMLGVMSCVAADVADATTITVASMYGSTHTWIACKSGNSSNGLSAIGKFIANGAASALLMRYE